MEAPEFGRHVEEGGFGVEHLLGFTTATTGRRVECRGSDTKQPFYCHDLHIPRAFCSYMQMNV